ncbi:MAG: type III pantothenate kinase [Prevotella sp.]
MTLTIDIGNTCAKLVAFDGNRIIDAWHIEYDEPSRLADFCHQHKFDKGVWSSVIRLSDEFSEAIDTLPFPMLHLQSGITPVPVAMGYDTPLTLGSDRLAAVVGALTMSRGSDILVIDVGTCITLDFVNAAGKYLGGNISPGPKMRFKALNTFTSALPMVRREGITPQLGTTTETAIRSGVMNGIRHELEGYIGEFKSKYPNLLVYLTGGFHIDLHNSEKMRTFADEFLVPRGLNAILQYNEAHNEK